MRVLEGGVFLTLAASVHIGLLAWSAPEDGAQASGAGGVSAVSLTGASGSLEALVEEWKTPPDLPAEVAEPPPPRTDTAPTVQETPPPNAPIRQAMALPPADLAIAPMIDSTAPQASTPPDPSQATTPKQQSRPTAPAPQKPSALASATPPDAPPATPETAAKPPPEPIIRPKARPERIAPQVAPPPSAPSARASGGGGGSIAGTGGSAPQSAPNPGQQASLMKQWSGQMQRRLQRNLVYPRKARSQRIEGRVVLRIRVSSTGAIGSVKIVRGSGHAILDRSAQDTLARTGSLPAAPKGIAPGNYTFDLPVSFRSR